MSKDLTEGVIHEVWLDEFGRIPKAVIREAVLYVFRQCRLAFEGRKTVRIDGLGVFYITPGRIKLLEERDEVILNGIEDTKNIVEGGVYGE